MKHRVPPPPEVESLVRQGMEDYRWRATERVMGSIRAIKGGLVIVATDGNLGCFVDSSGKPFLGPVQAFSGAVRTQRHDA